MSIVKRMGKVAMPKMQRVFEYGRAKSGSVIRSSVVFAEFSFERFLFPEVLVQQHQGLGVEGNRKRVQCLYRWIGPAVFDLGNESRIDLRKVGQLGLCHLESFAPAPHVFSDDPVHRCTTVLRKNG